MSRDHSAKTDRWSADRYGTVSLINDGADISGTYDRTGKRIADKHGRPLVERTESEILDSVNALLADPKPSPWIEWICYAAVFVLGGIATILVLAAIH